jgi:hypothetical protein
MSEQYHSVPESEYDNMAEGYFFKYNTFSAGEWNEFRGYPTTSLRYFKGIYPSMIFAQKTIKQRFPCARGFPFGY